MSGIFSKLLAALVGTPVNLDIYLSNGVKLTGIVEDFDDNSILIKKLNSMTIVERRHVTTLVPATYPPSILKGGPK